MKDWHRLDISTVLQRLGEIADFGLNDAEAVQRLTQYGPNELTERPAKPLWRMLWEQLTATTVLVLIAAAIIAALLGDYKDTVAIVAIVLFNAALGLSQEYQAGQAFAALKKLAVPTVRVCRGGQWQQLSSRQLLPGDLVRLEAGDFVPADGRLLESINLQVQEAAFTGESTPVEKNSGALAADSLPLSDRHNMVYLGTG
jgi:Ca2+-transporting ATPase